MAMSSLMRGGGSQLAPVARLIGHTALSRYAAARVLPKALDILFAASIRHKSSSSGHHVQHYSGSQRVNSSDTRRPLSYPAGPHCQVLHGGPFSLWFRVCSASKFLVKTGLGVRELKPAQQTLQLPFQTVTMVPMAPVQLDFDLHMMSSEKVPFKVPMVWTVGPYSPADNRQGFLNFVQKMSALDYQSLEETVRGVVHGTTRTLTAKMTIREIFEDSELFKTNVHDRVEKALLEFGIKCYNSNIAEMKDLDAENRYFENLKQKALEEASAEAKVAVAEARKIGNIGEAQRTADAKIEIAATNARLLEQENLRQEAIAQSNAALQIERYKCRQREEEQRVDSDMAPQFKQAEQQTHLNKMQAEQQQAKLRATQLAQTIVDNEAKIMVADANVRAAEAEAAAIVKIADAKASAIRLQAEAQAQGLAKLVEACPADPKVALQFVGIQSGMFDRMAETSAKAVQGLAPKINIWSTGSGGGEKAGFGALQDLFKSLPPVLDAVQSQTDIQVPSWLPQMPPAPKEGKNKR